MKLEERLLRSIKQRKGNIILRSEIAKLGSATQLSQALKSLQARGLLVRIGTGIYSKTRKSSVTGAIIPAGSLETLAMEALQKLGVAPKLSRLAEEYNAGKTTQLPGSFVANTGQRRITRKITVGGRSLEYENDYGHAAPSA